MVRLAIEKSIQFLVAAFLRDEKSASVGAAFSGNTCSEPVCTGGESILDGTSFATTSVFSRFRRERVGHLWKRKPTTKSFRPAPVLGPTSADWCQCGTPATKNDERSMAEQMVAEIANAC